VAALVLGSALGACGGDEERADADEPSGEFPMQVTDEKFPDRQLLANATNLELAVENVGTEQVPALTVTIYLQRNADGPFSIRSKQPGLANPNRPVWILEEGYPKLRAPGESLSELQRAPPAGAEVAQPNTFAFGPMAPGDTKRMVWRVTPVDGGAYTVNYKVAAGLYGQAEAVSPRGGPVEGSFPVRIETEPPETRVNDRGKVVPVD
jgi:hypothetical protein